VDRWALPSAVLDWCEAHRRHIALAAIPSGIALGIYTGILLSAFSARPFWNSGVLGPLFLVSGLSTAAALVALISRETSEKHLFTRFDLILIGAELALVGLFLIGLATGTAKHIEALQSITGGPFTMVFWVLFVGIGLVIPLLLEMLEMRGIAKSVAMLAPVLVLVGGYALRQVMIDVGQDSTWTRYPSQYSAEILERMERD